jgi:predicted O-methyltransferase YrrM
MDAPTERTGIRQVGHAAKTRIRRTARKVVGRLASLCWNRLSNPRRRRLAHELMPLQLDHLYTASSVWTEDGDEILRFLDLHVPSSFNAEFQELSKQLQLRADGADLKYPARFDVAPRTERLLFGLVRALQPLVVVETGVANGRSTAVILEALDLNRCGELHSVDIAGDVGALVPSHHPRWHLHVTDGTESGLKVVVESAGTIDLFVHDGDHSYKTQLLEYECARGALRPGGVVASDDVNWSNAFLDFCSANGHDPLVLSDVNKCFGVVRPDAQTLPTSK